MKTLQLLIVALVFASPVARAAPPRVASLAIPGTDEFVRVARDVVDVKIAMDPSMGSGVGLFDDSARVPSFSAASVAAMSQRLQKNLSALKAMPWRDWPVDRQIDFRLVYAAGEDALHQLAIDRLYAHRPANWLEPLSNNLINLVSYVPERTDLRAKIIAGIPAMVAEMRQVAQRPTARDVVTAQGVIHGLLIGLDAEKPSRALDAARKTLGDYSNSLSSAAAPAEFAVVGAESYGWTLKHTLLLPWSPQELLTAAEEELKVVDAQIAALKSHMEPVAPATPAQEALAKGLTREGLLGLYDQVVRDDLEALKQEGWVTVPNDLGPLRARETPDAMVPLIGDGGSMNPPPTFVDSNVGYWNVEHFHADWSIDKRLEKVLAAHNQRGTHLGPYAVHEGIPGHHFQLSIARSNPNPLRSLFMDNVYVEGWALYAEEAFWTAGGLGPSVAAHESMLGSWRFRIRRVVYDVNVETGKWTLQQAGDYKSRAEPGKGHVDEDIQRAINWPAQLICYFSGKMQIRRLKEDYKRKLGADYTDRRFHDDLLGVGSVPLAFVRAKLLGDPVPGIE